MLGFLVCWLSVCRLSGPGGGRPAGQLDTYPPPSRQGEHGVLDAFAKLLPSSCPRSPKSSLDWPLPCRNSREYPGLNFPCWAYVGISWPILALCWPILAYLGPMLAYLGPLDFHFCPSWPNLAPTWPQLGPTWSNLDPTWPNLALKSSIFDGF